MTHRTSLLIFTTKASGAANMNSEKGRKPGRRALASFIIMFSFIIMAVSGTILHMYDHYGSASIKHLAMAVHNASAFIFAIASIVHTGNNWRAITAYMRNYRREIGISFTLTTMIILMAVIHVYLEH
jgi:hypothetical protein